MDDGRGRRRKRQAGDLGAPVRLTAERRGDVVYVIVEIPEIRGDWGDDDEHASLDLIVEVPKTLALDVEDTSGELQIRSVGRPEEPMLEGWTALGWIAALTKRVRLGQIVICNGFRNPALSLADVDAMGLDTDDVITVLALRAEALEIDIAERAVIAGRGDLDAGNGVAVARRLNTNALAVDLEGNAAGMRRGGGHQQCGEDVELLHDRLLSGL